MLDTEYKRSDAFLSAHLKLYLVTDRPLCLGRDLGWVVEEAVKGGVTMVQLREKDIERVDSSEMTHRCWAVERVLLRF